MGILYPQEVVVSAAGGLYKHLLGLGYQVKYREKVSVNIEHLPPNSKAMVWVKCDFCGGLFQRPFSQSNKLPKASCSKCRGAYTSESKVKMLPPEQQRYHDKEWLFHQYIELGRSASDIAKECNVITQTVEAVLIKYQIYKMPTYEEVKLMLPKDVLYDMYIRQGMGVGTIAEQYPKIGIVTIKKLMDDYGISTMTNGELHQLFWQREDVRKKMSTVRKELWNDEEYRQKTLIHLQDESAIRERARKHSAHYQGITVEEWEDFITPENTRIRGSSEYRDWRNKVFERDNYTCQCCGARSRTGRAVILHAHHLESFAANKDERFEVNNGVTLCDECHDARKVGSFHNLYGTTNNTKAQYEEYIALRRGAMSKAAQ